MTISKINTHDEKHFQQRSTHKERNRKILYYVMLTKLRPTCLEGFHIHHILLCFLPLFFALSICVNNTLYSIESLRKQWLVFLLCEIVVYYLLCFINCIYLLCRADKGIKSTLQNIVMSEQLN